MSKNEYIFVVVAHSDDQIFGPGGTLIKYASEGKKIKTIIFSYGVLANPHYKKDVIRKIRYDESTEADKFIGGDGTIFFDMNEGKFEKEFYKKKYDQELKNLILKYKPQKIFTHATDDNLPDHKIVSKLVLETYDKLSKEQKFKTNIYTFGVWRFFKLKQRNSPRLVVDISETFDKKIEALKIFKSQLNSMISLKWSVYIKAFSAGFKHNMSLAEEFYKLR
ncbi:MAG: PIG-L family deacetylase [Candidatus Nanoarchaeia archaeon]|nr:PIG-L family deacetylase [Candidatus Nanoarchaeia archaeon]